MGIEPTQGKSGSPTATGADATHPLWVALADGVVGALLKAYDAAVAAGALVLRVQAVDSTGAKQPAGDVHDRSIWHKLTNGTLDALLKLTETAGALGNVVLATQNLDLTGKVRPAGEVATNAPFSRISDGTNANAAGSPLYVAWSTAAALIDRMLALLNIYDPNSIYSYSAGHMTIAGAGTDTLTFSGMSVVPTRAAQLRKVSGGAVAGGPTLQIEDMGNLPLLTWTAGVGGGTLVRASGTWPAVIHECTWYLPARGFNLATDSHKFTEQDPLDTHYDPITLVDASNLAATTYYYPSSAGQSHTPAGRKSLSIFGAASGGVTVTVEITNDPSAVPIWHDITRSCLEAVSGSTDNASFVDPASIALFLESLQCLAWRLKCVTSDASNALEFYAVANSL